MLELFHRGQFNPDPECFDFLDMLAGQTAIAIDSTQLLEERQRLMVDLTQAYDDTLESLCNALDLKDKETEGHSQRVTELAVQLARKLGIAGDPLIHIRRGALLHDIGKFGVPDAILLKPGPLNDDEWRLMRLHPTYAFEMLSPIAYLRPALEIPYCHHEKWDGSGYPRQLAGEAIPLAARIFAVVDVWEVLLSDRPYRPALSPETAREIVRSLSGVHLQAEIVEAFLKMA